VSKKRFDPDTPDPSSDDLCVVFAGGGSGGHIFPALAVAEQLLEQSPLTRVRFLHSRRPLDAVIMQQNGQSGEVIPAEPFGTRPQVLWRFVTHWGRAVRTARGVLRGCRREAEQVVVVTVGGFVAAPVARAARAEGLPVVLINLDAVPGKANRMIGRRATMACTTSDYRCPASWRRVRPLVRTAAVTNMPVSACRAQLGLDREMPTLFITGASQGARSVNQFMRAFVESHPEALEGWQVLHQTGAYAVESVEDSYRSAGIRARVVEFVDDMASAWRAADLALCRAGANTVAEVWANRVPALFMPYPYHRDEHQRHNAEPLVAAGAAEMCTDHVDAQQNVGDAGQKLARLLGEGAIRESMRHKAERLGPADGAGAIAEGILSMVRGV
jgi:UDP-N-acetylglucosamine--N-acetylmuramyl-(pentapeptide) pyrophosphoryl-undecaprenol N-acetylglucosamine transferase